MVRPRQRILGPWDERAPVRRSRHGLTANEIDEQVRRQGGVCAICQRPDRGPLQLDHDHTCHPGPVGCRSCARGMLCKRCNGALWRINDDPAVARRMADYLDPR